MCTRMTTCVQACWLLCVGLSLQLWRINGAGPLSDQSTRPVAPHCLSEVCSRGCVTCDGVAQCFDASDERGCDRRTRDMLNIIPPPPLPPPGVFLERLKLQLQRQKDKLSKKNTTTQTHTIPLPIPVSSTDSTTTAAGVTVTHSDHTLKRTIPVSHITQTTTTTRTTTMAAPTLPTFVVPSPHPTIPPTEPIVTSPRTDEATIFPWFTMFPPTNRHDLNPWFTSGLSTPGPDTWFQWFLGAPSVHESEVAPSRSNALTDKSVGEPRRPLLQSPLNTQNASGLFPTLEHPITSLPVSTESTTASPWIGKHKRAPVAMLTTTRPLHVPHIQVTTTAGAFPPFEPHIPITNEMEDDQDCMKIPDTEGFCRKRYQGLYRNPHNCASFYNCDWGYLHLCSCPPRTRFDVRHGVCNWDWAVEC